MACRVLEHSLESCVREATEGPSRCRSAGPDSISKRWTFRIKDLTCDGEKQHRVCRKVDARFSTKRGHPQDQADLDPHRQHTPTVNDRLESLFTLRGIRTQADISKERRASYADQSSTGE